MSDWYISNVTSGTNSESNRRMLDDMRNHLGLRWVFVSNNNNNFSNAYVNYGNKFINPSNVWPVYPYPNPILCCIDSNAYIYNASVTASDNSCIYQIIESSVEVDNLNQKLVFNLDPNISNVLSYDSDTATIKSVSKDNFKLILKRQHKAWLDLPVWEQHFRNSGLEMVKHLLYM